MFPQRRRSRALGASATDPTHAEHRRHCLGSVRMRMATLLTPHYSPPDRAHRPAPHGDRSVRWTIVTAILALGAFFLQPRLAGGNSFTPLALMATLPVILWAAIPLSRYKTPREHVVA